jgi:Zn-dependent protease with chaperone function
MNTARETSSKHSLKTLWFDGKHLTPTVAIISLASDALVVLANGSEQRFSIQTVRWPEQGISGMRLCDLPDGSSLQHDDGRQWDEWVGIHGKPPSWMLTWMKSRWGNVLAVLCLVAFVLVAWKWVFPAASEVVVDWLPPELEQKVGRGAYAELNKRWLDPSDLSEAEQKKWRDMFESMLRRAEPKQTASDWRLFFHKSKILGANAFALPGGDMVITDELIYMLKDQPDTVMGILGHEFGHVQHRHGIKMVVKAGLATAMFGFIIGDATGFLATVPTVLMTQDYSRQAEREADAAAAQFLNANDLHPRVMTVFFDRLIASRVAKYKGNSDPMEDFPIGFSSHPPDNERIKFFKEWKP